jgi:hypothetical protein
VPVSREEKVPAEVSKRGVMIDNLRELSPAGEREPISLYQSAKIMQVKNTIKGIFFPNRSSNPLDIGVVERWGY